MTILADENIPEVTRFFSRFGEVRTVEGWAIDRDALADVDILLVRSVTRVDARLLDESSVQFVGSATIGTDHVDQSALRERGINFAHAPGSNAESVAEYVTAALLELLTALELSTARTRLGIVGYGNIGRRVAQRALSLGMQVYLNDPPLADLGVRPEGLESFISLDRVLGECHVVTLHVPLTTTGRNATHGLIGAHELEVLRDSAALINTSRGPVVSGTDLKEALRRRSSLRGVLDVFEGEPTPDPALIERLYLATPHVAGYSYDGKLNGTRMLYQALCRHLGIDDALPAVNDDEQFDLVPSRGDKPETVLRDLVRQMYDIRADDRRMREILALPGDERAARFNLLRKNYPRRRSFDHFRIGAEFIPEGLRDAVTSGLQARLIQAG